MSRRGRAAIKSIVLDDSDEEETQNGNKSLLVPGKLSFTRAPGLKNPKPESSKPSKVEHKGGNDLHLSNTIADTGDAFGSGSPSQRIATIDISGDDILGFDVFAKTNKPVSYLVESQDQELSSEILLEDESASKPQKRKRLRKGDPSSASESGLSPRKGKSSRRQQDEDDDFQPTYVQDDEPIVPAKSKKRQRATGKSAAAEIDANTSSGQLDFVALPQLHVSPKASTSSLSSLSKQSTIVSTFQRMMAQKNSAPPPMQPVRASSDDDIIIVESVKPAPVPSAKSKSSEPIVAASPKRKFSVSRAAPASSDDFELYSQASKDSNNAILIKSTESLRYSSSGTEEPKANDGGQDWTSKYSPASREQLAVPAKKVQEFADLIIQAIQDSKMPTPVGEIDRRLKMIVVQGPPGSGKTAALKVLSRSLSELSGAPSEFNYLEWRNQVVSRSSYGMEIGNRPSHVQYEPPLLDTFFMWLSGRRQAGVLHFEAPESFEGSHIGNSDELPLLVVEDLPNVFTLQQKQQFQAEIRASLHTNPYKPVVWIISDDAGGQSPVRTLFGEDFLTSPHVKSVTFRPVTKKNALQALRRILESEKVNENISDADLNAIVEIADGDLRSAINSLQWLSNTHQQPSNLMSEPASSKSKSKNKKPVKKAKVESSGANIVRSLMNRDSSLSLFHAVGKVLFNKRLDTSGEETVEGIASLRPKFEARSDGESTRSPYWRPPLKSKPEHIMDNFVHTESDLFNLFLHENYLSFLGNSESFSSDSLDSCADYFSVSDLLQATSMSFASQGLKVAHFHYSGSGQQGQQQRSTQTVSREGAALVTMYGTAYSNTADTPRGKDVSRFKKSRLNLATYRQRENGRLINSLLRLRLEKATIANVDNSVLPISAAVSVREAATQLLPFIHRIETKGSGGSSSESFIKLMCWYSVDSKSTASTGGRDQLIDANFKEALEDLENDGDAAEKARSDSLEANFSRELYDKLNAELASISRDLKNSRSKTRAVMGDEEDPIQND